MNKSFKLVYFLMILLLISFSGWTQTEKSRLIVLADKAGAQQTGSWGDQGDGTYKNPILDSNFPDDDIIRVGDTFYKMSSTNHLVPGMTILKSKDLVNWEYGNPIMTDPITFSPQFEFGKNLNFANNGTWAGQFGYNGEDYFAYWCYTEKRAVPDGHFRFVFAKAKSMEGPWSEPKELTWPDGSSINQTDPGILFDVDTKKAWLSVDGTIYKLSWDGSKVLQNKEEGIETVPQNLSGEAAKLYKIDGIYYAMNVHAGKDGRNQVLAKATNIEGPWESRVVLEGSNGTNGRPAAQGTLLKLDDCSWWFVVHASTRERVGRGVLQWPLADARAGRVEGGRLAVDRRGYERQRHRRSRVAA